ncbi:MAG: hypothetical protein KatS3mg094_372 [Candidatus Parcubacteria bacterium]|nr:MAG: hypothetical protein KatS3mg094_372 [Candidatus Parcubacteria bacterium]
MKNKAQLESLIQAIIIILLTLSGIIYYLQFRLNYIPQLKIKKDVSPAEKSILPEGTFFKQKKENKIPFLKTKYIYAQTKKKNYYKNNADIETFLISPKIFSFIEDNLFDLLVSGIDKKNPSEKIFFQYKIEPLNKNWQIIYGKHKKIFLPKGLNTYKLYVRAINKKNEIDPTPAIAYIMVSISNYYKDIDIKINSARNLITLTNKSRNSINVTNWKLISSKVNFTITQAVKDVNPNLDKKLEDIILKPNERIIIYPLYATTANFIPPNFKYPYPLESPLGFNFKINKCFNYLTQLRWELKDYLRQYYFPCNRFTKFDLFSLKTKYNLSDNCLNILSKISCSGPKNTDWEKIIYDSQCYKFFEENFTYRGCYQNKKNDNDFYFKDWIIFIPIYESFSKQRYDEIKLYDDNNLIVNKIFVY